MADAAWSFAGRVMVVTGAARAAIAFLVLSESGLMTGALVDVEQPVMGTYAVGES